MKKNFKYIIYILLILFVGFVLFFVYRINKVERLINVTEEKYKMDIKNTTNKEVFPFFDISANTASKENKDYLYKNYLNLNYDFNVNTNVKFNMVLPKYLNHKMNMSKDDPFESTDSRYVLLGELKDDKRKIAGAIYGFNTDLEVDSNIVNISFIVKTLNLLPVKIKYDYFIDGFKSDILAINNETGEFTRSTVVRSSSLYYILTFTFKNFYHYMQHAKEVSIMFASFNPKRFSNKLSNVDLELLKIKNYDLLYPKGWNVENKYDKKIESIKISISNKPKGIIFDMNIYENSNYTIEELIKNSLNNINENNFLFDGIDYESILHNEETNRHLFFLKNAKTSSNIPVTICVKIEEKGNKKLVGILYTTRNEEQSYLRYKEYERIFEIIFSSLSLRLFSDLDIHDTDWIKLHNNK